MCLRLVILFLFFCDLKETLCHRYSLPKDGTTKVTIVTTAGSLDTAKFLSSKGFRETYSSFMDFMEVQFIPVGQFKKRNGVYVCENGFEEYCEANDYQRCALELLQEDTAEQINYMLCVFEIKSNQFMISAKEHINRCLSCAEASGLHPTDVLDCYSSPTAEKLAEEAEYETAALRSLVKSPPAFMFDDIPDADLNKRAYSDFPYTVCEVLLRNGVDRCHITNEVW